MKEGGSGCVGRGCEVESRRWKGEGISQLQMLHEVLPGLLWATPRRAYGRSLARAVGP